METPKLSDRIILAQKTGLKWDELISATQRLEQRESLWRSLDALYASGYEPDNFFKEHLERRTKIQELRKQLGLMEE